MASLVPCEKACFSGLTQITLVHVDESKTHGAEAISLMDFVKKQPLAAWAVFCMFDEYVIKPG
jgi:hypothetical protein